MICEHGQLQRQCETCDLIAECGKLRAQLELAKTWLAADDAFNAGTIQQDWTVQEKMIRKIQNAQKAFRNAIEEEE